MTYFNYTKTPKTAAQLDLERRRELGKLFPSTVKELLAIAEASGVVPRRIPFGHSAFSDPDDPDEDDEAPKIVTPPKPVVAVEKKLVIAEKPRAKRKLSEARAKLRAAAMKGKKRPKRKK